ncbi:MULTISPECIES: two-component system histidine kinase PnpS [Clostridia]|uniref:two-component system histidine kinase PnpS n=1 Tax=Clostridia TaxID=186801 RepID=UPI000EA067F9|nr:MULTISPECIES: HAMP domain-containing sensor histidine kinase [Clostridia]NBJ68984.1 PAS domain S-box protein [Roseburia sp. 1XD42-34]RKI79886.1 PAS domain S-box protein [Clostridium sp. 1xD42-85]
MRFLFEKPIFGYTIGIFLVVSVTGILLSVLIGDYLVIASVLVIQFIILFLFLLHLYESVIKPVKKATKTVGEIVKGNYRARFHHPSTDSIGQLSTKINALARNLNELTIQEQMQAEQLSTIIENTQSGLVLIDAKGYIHFVNRKFLTMFGQTTQDFQGYLYYDVLHNETIHETVQKTFLYERNIKEEFTHYKGLDKYYIEIVGAPIFDDRNLLKGAVLVLYDITELKKLELMRKDFVANVSHELKTPITSIKGFAETLLDDPMKDLDKSKEFLEIIYKESHRLQLLIQDLLILSRLEKENFQLVLSTFSVNDVVNEVLPIIEQRFGDKHLTFDKAVDDHIQLTADKEKVKQIIINLVDNAVNYTPEKGNIYLRITECNDSVCIEVEDTGIGIEKEALPRIFERFYRVDKARSRNTGGTGLGLAIVKHIVEVHDGTIEIESEVNKGTKITVSLPINNMQK